MHHTHTCNFNVYCDMQGFISKLFIVILTSMSLPMKSSTDFSGSIPDTDSPEYALDAEP